MKLKNKFVLFLLLFSTTFSAFAQEPILTKKQMYKDFDQLVKIIEDCNVQLPVRKAVTGYDNLAEIKKLRTKVDTVSSFESYRGLIAEAVLLLKDPHTEVTERFLTGIDKLKKIDTTALKEIKELLNSPEKRAEKIRYYFSIYSPVPAVLIGEDYYLYGDFLFHNNNKDSLKIHLMKLITYNGQDFQEYVDENFQGNVWDYEKKRYVYPYVNLNKDAVFEGEQDGKMYKFNMKDYPFVNMGSYISNISLEGVPKRKDRESDEYIKYFEKDDILYIYLYTMLASDGDSLFLAKIKEIGREKKINKVVIDVRGNSGGSDLTWHNLLTAIVKDSLEYKVKFAFNDSKTMRRYYPDCYRKETIDWLDNQNLRIIDIDTYLIPDTNSLNYDGKIYILSDEGTYSAGHSFVTYADHLDQLVSVGTKTGHLVGFGLVAPLFQLKNSKLGFRLPCIMDMTNCSKPIDVYHDIPEIEIYPTFQEYIYLITDHDRISKEYLYKYDPWFRKVLELE